MVVYFGEEVDMHLKTLSVYNQEKYCPVKWS